MAHVWWRWGSSGPQVASYVALEMPPPLCGLHTEQATHSAEEASIARSGASTRLSAGSTFEETTLTGAQSWLERGDRVNDSSHLLGCVNSKHCLLTTSQGLLQGQQTC